MLQEVKSEIIATSKDSKSLLQRVLQVITIIAFLLSVYQTYLTKTDLTNEETVSQIDQKTKIIKEELLNHVDSLLGKDCIRSIRISCSLKNKPINNSGIICSLEKNDTISIIDSSGKYFLVVLKNLNTQFPFTGWVLKKCNKELVFEPDESQWKSRYLRKRRTSGTIALK